MAPGTGSRSDGTSGGSCVRIGCLAGFSNPSTISSTTAATLGIHSSTNPGRSCPSRNAIGRQPVTQSEDWYKRPRFQMGIWQREVREANSEQSAVEQGIRKPSVDYKPICPSIQSNDFRAICDLSLDRSAIASALVLLGGSGRKRRACTPQ